jgi:hypothetical protein
VIEYTCRKEVDEMERTYTEQEIKDWFADRMKDHPNSPFGEHLRQVYDEMFDPFWKRNNLQTFVEKRVDK